MTCVSTCPLAMPPMIDDMGDRLASYGGGVLTLVAFKYGVADHMPSVPYRTFADNYLQGMIVTISFAAFESVISFNVIMNRQVVRDDPFYVDLDCTETVLYFLLVGFWSMVFLYAWCYKPMHMEDWKDVWCQKDTYFEQVEPEEYDPHSANEITTGMKLEIK